MDELDQKIMATLAADEAAEFERTGGEQSLPEMVFGTFRGRHRWMMMMAWAYTAVFFGIGVWFAIEFFQAGDVRHTLMWGFGAMFCMMAVSFLKLWMLQEMQKNAIIREVKRVELQVARLSAKLNDGS